MNLSDYFTFAEMTDSKGHPGLVVANRKLAQEPKNLVALTRLSCQILDPLRKAWGKPIFVNSGFRSPALNTAVGGSQTSQHSFGEAADITVRNASDNIKLWELARDLCKMGEFSFGQLILETPGNSSWIHISLPTRSKNNQLMTFDGRKYTTITYIK